MTPLQIAAAHCANWRSDNHGCLGAMIEDDLQIRRCCPKPKCVVGTPGLRCRYFEECVLPMGSGIQQPVYRLQFEVGIRQYRLAANMATGPERTCPVCGRTMTSRKRFCPVCTAAKRREANRDAKVKSRVRCQQLTQKQPLSNNGLRGVFYGSGRGIAEPAKNPVNC